jgi:GGDEF domain-containing protein
LSVGVAQFDASRAATLETMIAEADRKLYQEKRHKQNASTG